MTDKKTSYLEKQLEAALKFEQDKIVLTFQREKIKLANELEITLLQENNPFIEKNITLTEDELIFTYKKEPNFMTFGKLRTLDERSRWMFASKVLRFIMLHQSNRLHLIVCPENILIDESLTAYFLHYGVKESIPPYERNKERLWAETKAIIAAAVQPKYKFDQYIQFSKSIELSPVAVKIMEAKDEQELLTIIQDQLQLLEKEAKKYTKIAKTKWNWVRYSLMGLLVVLLPLGIYTGYAALVIQPQQEAYVAVQAPYIQGNYSEIIDQLAQYDVEKMPNVIQYELSLAYIVNETLTEEQKENVLKTITLQTDPDYFKYWIYIGRGQAEEALTVARQLEDLDLIMLALLHYEESIKADRELDGEEREQLLDKVQTEINEVTKQLEELKEALESEDVNTDDGKDSVSKQEQEKAEEKNTVPESTNEAKAEKTAQPEKTKEEAGAE
ncbi:type VII secretion protein EssB [Solibacillus isronensis B3W22]|uniref:Type VII secretion protein EssB n=1 Tax=Solibacillus isronensis B3W22 TaxID=1224748 RepID=K1KNR5_9BACL|nr:type VII secretion protein EssB [Solibacillus isronensis]AMO86256.1 type VII secretion protein EssB [Solibacillus silvestris]EKB45745.1 type VII secretion protein EssB [Solibacillus isronensis B3W22]